MASASPPATPSGPPFIALRRATPARQTVQDRVQHWGEFHDVLSERVLREQGSRCMDCGVPFCQSDSGCPVRNVIPEWNELVRRGRWRDALESLHATNNFPEFTGRLCPAPCESACVLGTIEEPVAIRAIEQAIVDRGFEEGWITPQTPARETGRRVAIVGSGPAGLAAAQQLRRFGHVVDVYEKSDRVGGLLRYGIPGFKLEKRVLDRRIAQLTAEGVHFHTATQIGRAGSVARLRRTHHAICLAIGAEAARDLDVPGRDLAGVELAMTFLSQQNRRDAGDALDWEKSIDAHGKHVVIIGGGDTGSDCAGTCIRQGAASVRQFELLTKPPESRDESTPWPMWPMQLRTSHAHEEGCERDWCVLTTAFSGTHGHVQRLHGVRVAPAHSNGRTAFRPIPGSEFDVRADLVLLAMGFTGPRREALSSFDIEANANGTVRADNHQTSVPGIFAAGDVRRGASLIVWAIREGRDAATRIHSFLASTATPLDICPDDAR